MNFRTLIIFFILCVLNGSIYSQQPFFKNYSVEDGLPSSEIYDLLQDTKGYIWIATSKGVSRFDGYEFRNFSSKDGLAGYSILRLYEDFKGRVWTSSYEGYLSYFEKGKFNSLPLNDTIAKLSHGYIDNLYVDSLENIWLMPARGNIFRISKSQNITKETLISTYVENTTLFFKVIGKNLLWETRKIENTETLKNPVYNYISGLYSIQFDSHENQIIKRDFRIISKDEILISFGNKLFYIKNNKLIESKVFKNEISGLYVDEKHNFFINIMYDGIYYYPKGNLLAVPEVFLQGTIPSAVMLDREKNFWFATTEGGVFFLNSLQFKNYDLFGNLNYNITAMNFVDGYLYFSSFNQQSYKCKVEGSAIKTMDKIDFQTNEENAICDILGQSNGTIWFLGSKYLSSFNPKKGWNKYKIGGYKLGQSSNDEIMVSSYGYLFKLKDDQILSKVPKNSTSPIHSAYEDVEKCLWLGTNDGLYSYRNDSLKFHGNLSPLLKSKIGEIISVRGSLWMATIGEGILVYNGKKVFHINEQNGLNSNFINTIFSDNDSIIWVGSNKGLSKIYLNKTYQFPFLIENFTGSEGLFSEEIKFIKKYNDHIWLGTTKGIISFDYKKLIKNVETPSIIVDSICINDKSVEIKNSYFLSSDMNSISVYYKAFYYKAPNKVQYHYKMSGFGDNWVTTTDKQVRFANLTPGNYKLNLLSSMDKSNEKSNLISISFFIDKPFTSGWLFIFLSYLAGILIILVVVYYIYKYLKNKIETERRLLFSEQKALKAQMNPHFIFNSINSIRRFILENDGETADFYLTSFASLMRKVLENSNHNFISLRDELETLRLYLELEKLRFDENFEYSIKLDPEINIDEFKLPPMLIQPFLENAIWHGLMPKNDNRQLILNFKNLTNMIGCMIEDNGIGRKKSNQINLRRKNHQSTSLKNIQERIDLLNKLNSTQIEVKIEDLYDEKNEPKGTRIDIHLPFQAFN
jgi:hypothetical protein